MKHGMRTALPARASLRRAAAALATLLLATACGDSTAPEVVEPIDPTLRVEPDSLYLAKGESAPLTASLRDGAGQPIAFPPGYEVDWSSSNPAVATASGGVVLAVGAGLAVVTARSGPLAPVTITVTVVEGFMPVSLGTMGGTTSDAWAINGAGVVAGNWNASTATFLPPPRAFRWVPGAGGDLGLNGYVDDINAAGAIVGLRFHPQGGSRAYVWHAGSLLDLPPLPEGDYHQAHSINDAGTVAGTSRRFGNGPSDSEYWAVVWQRGADGTYGIPARLGRDLVDRNFINNRGDVAGTLRVHGLAQPVVWAVREDGTYGAPRVLGQPAAGGYIVRGINDAGSVVGIRLLDATPPIPQAAIALLWHHSDYDTPIVLGRGDVWGINSHHQMVGALGDSRLGGFPFAIDGELRPVMWTWRAGGSIETVDLGTPPGFGYGGARSINDSGVIAGVSWDPHRPTATLWRPIP
jgi:uncharacterized membrane protein